MLINELERDGRVSEAPASPGVGGPLSRIWPELVAGRARIIASGATSAHYFLRLAPGAGEVSSRQLRDLALLERLLLGESQKSLAFETGYSASTIATAVGSALEALGLSGGARRVSLVLPLLLHAGRGHWSTVSTRVEQLGDHENELFIVSERPEPSLSGLLSRGEIDVLSLLMEGKSYAQISARRATSSRTVANQIANVYKKLRVSGRLELLVLLAIGSPALIGGASRRAAA
jgi:DNA-binding NarL/FixJ family response regulator